ncbi:hypothetical protein KR093_008128, partial [Drosophila rubida]
MGNLLGREECGRVKEEDIEAGKAFLQPPIFNRSAPLKWFTDIEDYFEEFQICSDAAKCDVLIDTLDRDIIELITYQQLCGIVNPPGDRRYETLKNIVLH